MIEEIVYDFLCEKMSVPVKMELPADPSEKMIIVEKTGSSLNEFIHTSTFAIQSYGPSLFEAAELNELLKATVLDGTDGLIALNRITHVELNSDYNYTDTTNKKYRYQAVFVITHY